MRRYIKPILWAVIGSPILASVLGLGLAIASSDWPPWISIRSVQSMFLIEYSKQSLHDYCEAEDRRNTLAARAANDDIQIYEQQYQRLNNGQSIILRPCP